MGNVPARERENGMPSNRETWKENAAEEKQNAEEIYREKGI